MALYFIKPSNLFFFNVIQVNLKISQDFSARKTGNKTRGCQKSTKNLKFGCGLDPVKLKKGITNNPNLNLKKPPWITSESDFLLSHPRVFAAFDVELDSLEKEVAGFELEPFAC